MTLTANTVWIYVTDVQFRYDAGGSKLAIARLEGILPNGERIRKDSTRKLPPSFRPVDSLVEIGPLEMNLAGELRQVKSINYTVTKLGLILVSQFCDWCQVIENDPNPDAPCQLVAGGNCNNIFCWPAQCRAVPGDPCDCNTEVWWDPSFCYLIPGGTCKGSCPDLKTCRMVTPNPGQFGCACVD
jgi:hypothetical protein